MINFGHPQVAISPQLSGISFRKNRLNADRQRFFTGSLT
jgi:hypothetical protein